MQPNHPHPPCFPTQSVLNSYPARTRSESRLRSSLHAIHSLAAYKKLWPFQMVPSRVTPLTLHGMICAEPCGCPKREASARWYHGRKPAWTCIHIHTHTKVPDVRPRSTRDNVRCTANQPAVRQGERAEGPSWLCVDVIWAQRHAFAVILGYCSIIQGKYAWRK